MENNLRSGWGHFWEIFPRIERLMLFHTDKMVEICHLIWPPKMKRCVVGIRPSGKAPDSNQDEGLATVWFPSMASMAAVLSEDNQALLDLIDKAKPKTLTELAALSGRKVPNLSRTLRTMESYGLVALKKNIREVEPVALATRFTVQIN